MKARMGILVLAFGFLLFTACDRPDGGADETVTAEGSDALLVYVVNGPLRYFAERIGGEQVDVRFPCPAGEDPAYWKPDAAAVAAYQQADLILTNGASYAGWIAVAALPPSALVDTSSGFVDRYIPLESAVTHSHGPEGAHEHAGWAFTTWLDPTLAAEQARAVAEALVEARPDHEAAFRARLAELESDLIALDERMAVAAGRIGDRPVVFSHPVYQYLERRYGLNGRSLHWEPGETPDLTELRQLLDDHPARWMVWEREPLPQTVLELEGLGVASAVFDPCGGAGNESDFLGVMAGNAAALERVAASIAE